MSVEEVFSSDTRSFSACATISETARELCKAVSVSLGLSVEAEGDAAPLLQPPPPPLCAAGDELQHGHKQLVDMLKSCGTAARLHQQQQQQEEQEPPDLQLCKAADDMSSEEMQHLDTAASCPYAQSAPLSHFGEAMESRFAAYQQEQYGFRIKCEDPDSAGPLWSNTNSYGFTEGRYAGSQVWGTRQSPAAAAAAPLCAYGRSAVRPAQWCQPYPNPNYLKTDVGEWLDVAYTDGR